MNKEPYLYNKEFSTRYRFFSTGKKPVEKIVEFTPLAVENIYNLGFGDLLPDGSIDDKANSNNGDIIKVLSTIVYIYKRFHGGESGAKNRIQRKHKRKNGALPANN